MPDKKKKIVICAVLFAVIVVATAVEILFAEPHYKQVWKRVPGADAVIGFVGALLIIFVVKVVMNKLLRRGEKYYDKGGKRDD